MRTPLIFLLLMNALFVTAQVPGYMGKKTTLLVNPTIGIAFSDHTGIYEDVAKYRLNYQTHISVDRTISTNSAIGASVRYSTPKLYGGTYIESVSEVNGNNTATYTGFCGDIKMKSLGLGIFYKHFTFRNTGSIAPLGKYHAFELCFVNIGAESIGTRTPEFNHDDISYSVDYALSNDLSTLPYADVKTWNYGFIYSFGQQRIVNDVFCFNMAASFGLFRHLLGDGGNITKNQDLFYESGLTESMQTRIAGAYMVNLSAGIGLISK